jgi:hypothetical protein
LVNIRLTNAEAEQFRAQAAARKMELGPYLRFLAMEDGERLVSEGKIRRTDEGNWEVLVMGVWERL